VSRVLDCIDPAARREAVDAAVSAVNRGDLVVLPTDTVYGVGADAFSRIAVRDLLAAKGRGREMPPPVLVGSRRTLDGIATDISEVTRDLVDAFWPGALTLVCWAQASLAWDLGETHGTVAVRMPDHDVALELLARTGPLAVTSANRHGEPPATSVEEALAQLGESVTVYLDGGRTAGAVPSTIVDVTGDVPRVLRLGALDPDRLREVAPGLVGPEGAAEQG
jgi:tRNA threonylcarbamoyl adenosine modification protein (Sua5/YciO/YrdC/YwlC family)